MGLLLVYTGNGKGKTTAALGLVLRASGHGLKSIVAHLMKTPYYRSNTVGEREALAARLGDLVEEYFMDPLVLRNPRAVLRRAVQRSVEVRPFLLVLDEANNSIKNGLLGVDELLSAITEVPSETNVVVTGRGAPEELVERADLVTEMKEVKHYYDKGFVGLMGLEW
ncbi:cobinamide adenolsyltransferase [Thermocladium modestius]|uniref:Cobinamide adenolsyltransferase n=1 Tax=Thermocladium modestius TaxID=62609 RepID=A0A830GWD8_9CREN|nr:cob(I)yrinic acid a,c-diamide adenosyltransferase [Thermocladium modestius]GGP21323.1 cobinamide adenolsyltransferase [Thermocladium modestius]